MCFPCCNNNRPYFTSRFPPISQVELDDLHSVDLSDRQGDYVELQGASDQRSKSLIDYYPEMSSRAQKADIAAKSVFGVSLALFIFSSTASVFLGDRVNILSEDSASYDYNLMCFCLFCSTLLMAIGAHSGFHAATAHGSSFPFIPDEKIPWADCEAQRKIDPAEEAKLLQLFFRAETPRWLCLPNAFWTPPVNLSLESIILQYIIPFITQKDGYSANATLFMAYIARGRLPLGKNFLLVNGLKNYTRTLRSYGVVNQLSASRVALICANSDFEVLKVLDFLYKKIPIATDTRCTPSREKDANLLFLILAKAFAEVQTSFGKIWRGGTDMVTINRGTLDQTGLSTHRAKKENILKFLNLDLTAALKTLMVEPYSPYLIGGSNTSDNYSDSCAALYMVATLRYISFCKNMVDKIKSQEQEYPGGRASSGSGDTTLLTVQRELESKPPHTDQKNTVCEIKRVMDTLGSFYNDSSTAHEPGDSPPFSDLREFHLQQSENLTFVDKMKETAIKELKATIGSKEKLGSLYQLLNLHSVTSIDGATKILEEMIALLEAALKTIKEI